MESVGSVKHDTYSAGKSDWDLQVSRARKSTRKQPEYWIWTFVFFLSVRLTSQICSQEPTSEAEVWGLGFRLSGLGFRV